MSPAAHEYVLIILILVISITTASVKGCDAELEGAISRGDLETIQRVLERDTNFTFITKRGRKIACMAAEKGNLNIIAYMAARKSSVLDKRCENGDTIGHIAAENGYLNIVEYFTKEYRSHGYRWKPDDKESFFSKAAKRGHLNVIQCLEKKFRLTSEQCVTVSKLAADNGHLDVACHVVLMDPIGCDEFKDIIRTAIQKSQKRDNRTLGLILKLATKWEERGYCRNIVELADEAEDTELIRYLAENRCTLFVDSASPNPARIAFEKNLVNRKFLQCLEAHGALHQKFGWEKLNIGHVATKYGCLEVIQFLAKKNASILTEFTNDGRTAANIAAKEGRADIVRCVLRVTPLSAVMKDWQEIDEIRPFSTVFHLAMAYRYLDMDLLKYLVEEKKFPLTKTDGDGETVAHTAAKTGDMEKLKYLVKKDPSTLTMQDECYRYGVSSKDTILHTLATKHILSGQSLKFFVDKGAPLTVQNQAKNTVGHILAENGHTDFVKYLVEKEPSILRIQNRNGDTICHILARKDMLSVKNLRFFVEKGASLFAKNRTGYSIALIAAETGKLCILAYIIEKEPLVFAENASLGVELGNLAAECGRSNVLKLIAERESAFLVQRPNVLFKLPNPFDVFATLRHLVATCETKIHNWDLRSFEKEILREALDHNYPDVLKCMKYDVNMLNDRGEPLIFTAIRRQRDHIFHYLVTDGQANLTALDHEGSNILFVAAMNGDLEKVKHILDTLKAPIDIEWRNKAGDSLLHVAVHEALEQAGGTRDSEEQSSEERMDKLRVIEYLIEHRHADINARGHGNKTVLQVATARGNKSISKYLLDHGADPKLCYRHQYSR